MKKLTAIFLTLVMLIALIPHSVSADDEIFLIGLIPEENIFRAIQKHRPLEAYLTERLGVKVKFTILSRYGDIIERFRARDMDGAFFGIYTSALAMDSLDVEPVVRTMNIDGSTTSRGYLFTRKDSGIRTLNDMKNKRAAFVDKATATGYIFVVAYLKEHGIKDIDKFFSEQSYMGSHESAIFAVLDGRADVGAIKGRVLERLIQKDPLIGDEIYIIAQSVELPDGTLMMRKNIDPEMKRKLKEALLNLNRTEKGIQILDTLGIKSYVDASNEDFKVVKDLARKAGIKTSE